MKYRKMGSLPWEVSALGFGCMRLPTTPILHRVDERQSISIIRKGIDLGINYVDTAWMYHMGNSEKILGKALQDGYRQKIKLVTKLPMIFMKKEEDFDRFFNQQLERLQTDYLDMYLFHMLNETNFEKLKQMNLISKMEKARADGKIKHIGFSFHDTLPVFKKIIDFYPWDMAQIQYNYLDTNIQATSEGLQYAHNKGIAVVIMEPLKGGQLANPPKEAIDVINKSDAKRTPVDWALQFLWNRPEVATVLSGMGSMKMVEENCSSADKSGIGSLTPHELTIIDQLTDISKKKIIVPCTACQYCIPCPAGVNIPQNFALLNNKSFSSEGSFMSRLIQGLFLRNYKKLSTSKSDAVKNNNGRATLCVKCNKCIPKCPQQINIPSELEKVVAVFEKRQKVEMFRMK
ncbi:MAG TPA: aldo/keto reductase [Chitinispirillaceae bacterium]|nr:aldo/keto reductase [Chitinispirillaceae bacterium]